MTEEQQQAHQYLESQRDYIPSRECAWGTAMTKRGCALWRGKNDLDIRISSDRQRSRDCLRCKHREDNPSTAREKPVRWSREELFALGLGRLFVSRTLPPRDKAGLSVFINGGWI